MEGVKIESLQVRLNGDKRVYERQKSRSMICKVRATLYDRLLKSFSKVYTTTDF